MKSFKQRAALLSGLAMATTLAVGSMTMPARAASTVKWETSLATAQQKAKASGKPILIDFYTSWCAPCKVMDKKTYPNAAVIKESQKWIMLKIDAMKQESVAAKYKVEGYPTILFLKPNGQSVGGVRQKGLSASALLAQMRANYSKARK